MLSILFVCLFLVGWIWSEKIQEFLWKWLPLEVCGAWNNSVLQYTGVCVCVSHFSVARVFLFVSFRCKTHHKESAPLHTHTHTQFSRLELIPAPQLQLSKCAGQGLIFWPPASCIFHHDRPVPTQPLPLHNAIDWRLSHQTLIKSLIF